MLCHVVQAGALQELQKRFDQQEHQLAAATATAASTNGSEGVQVEPYFPEEKVQQELTMLHKVRPAEGHPREGGRWPLMAVSAAAPPLCWCFKELSTVPKACPRHQKKLEGQHQPGTAVLSSFVQLLWNI